MRNHSLGRGRGRSVEKFTNREGLWMLGIVGVICLGILLLFLLGSLNADLD
jgi:hypothetical protein